MRKIEIHFGNEEKSRAWVEDVRTQSARQIHKLGSVLNTLPAENRDKAFDALRALLGLLGDVIVTQAKATEGLRKEIPAAFEAITTFDAREKARKRIEKDADGKQAAKVEAFKLWQDWQAGKTLHKSGAAFARFVCEKCPVLESSTTVERWSRKWAAEKSKKALS